MTTQQRRWIQATVNTVDEVANDIRRIELRIDRQARADPGMHVDVEVLIDGRPDVRSYSIVESGPDGSTLVLTIARARPGRGGSAYMHSLAAGDNISVTLPLQNFPLLYGSVRYVLVAGGIGITALHAMARRLRQRGNDYLLIYAGRTRDVMAYLDELAEEHGERLRRHVDDEQGRLDIADLVGECDTSTVLYVCGPKGMMDAISSAWTTACLPPANLRFETFGNSGCYSPEEFVVGIPRLGIETTVPVDSTMLDALEAAGAEVMYDCLRGECGLCEVRILEVDGFVDHRDVFLSERQHESNQTLCTCVTRVASRRNYRARIEIDIP